MENVFVENVFHIKIQSNIILNYRDDIAKYARGEKKNKIRAVFDSVPTQLAKENKKFQYALLEKENKKGYGNKYKDSVNWLIDANIVRKCSNVYEPIISLKANSRED